MMTEIDFVFWYWWVICFILFVLEKLKPGYLFMWMAASGFLTGVIVLLIPVFSMNMQILIFSVLSVYAIIAWMTEKTEINPSDIGNVLTAIFNGVEEESKAIFESVSSIPSVKRAVDCVRKDDCKGFYFALIYPISKMVNGLLAKELPNSPDAQFLLKNSLFIENHFKKLIEKLEGSACCADKSRTIMKHLLRFLKTGEEITFDYTQEYTYHLPVLIFNTHDEIVAFFKALRHLHYGYPDSYIETLAKIYKRVEELRATALLNNL